MSSKFGGTQLHFLLSFYFLVAAVSFYAVSRATYQRALNILHFPVLLAAVIFWDKVTDPSFVKMMFFATGKSIEQAHGFGVAAYFGSFAGGIFALIAQFVLHLMFGYLIGSCLGIIRLALFGAPKTKWI